jgi:hypothetical protein
MENRHGLCLDVAVDQADGYAERRCAAMMLERTYRHHEIWPKTLGADAAYKDGQFLARLEADEITPHVPLPEDPIRGQDEAARARRRARRRRKTKSYVLSQRIRKRVEEIIGWCKEVGGLARARFVGRWKITQQADVTVAAYNLVRLARLAPSV